MNDEPEGPLGHDRRVRGARGAVLRARGDGALANRVGVHGDLLRLPTGTRGHARPRRPRTPGGADVLPDTEGATPLGQGHRGRVLADRYCLADLDALGRREVRVVRGPRLATDTRGLGTCALP